ncbi:epimerase [Rouxiella badensis]|uniref:NAD-dependent epimerase/dehydratase family protein n=1 Tax=Rouxiella badensis TaxID=1646377 RepID=UPI001B536466|nr:NAD-dependent epimerase/dehydratase family protein [Rouxiella badensis]MCC3701701.1 epimerase [Rouxiella badensis]MCC3748750.1 epimerase [Rouxiella badensis]
MRILILGATGMVGQGVLREALLAEDVTEVVVLGRTPVGKSADKLTEIVHSNLFDLSDIESRLGNFSACFFCLGVSSFGMSEVNYVHITYGLTLSVAHALLPLNPMMTFVYVSGAGTDSTERGKTMWARVKGKTENALLGMPFKAVYLFRPGIIQPLHGVKSKTRAYRLLYPLLWPFITVLRPLIPGVILTTENVGRAMLNAARRGEGDKVLESKDIYHLSRKNIL